MAYSKVTDPVVRMLRRSENILIEGDADIQDLNYIERKAIRIYWAINSEIQAEIVSAEAEVSNGWIIDGEISRTPVVEPLNLYNAVINMHRYVKII